MHVAKYLYYEWEVVGAMPHTCMNQVKAKSSDFIMGWKRKHFTLNHFTTGTSKRNIIQQKTSLIQYKKKKRRAQHNQHFLFIRMS